MEVVTQVETGNIYSKIKHRLRGWPAQLLLAQACWLEASGQRHRERETGRSSRGKEGDREKEGRRRQGARARGQAQARTAMAALGEWMRSSGDGYRRYFMEEAIAIVLQ